MHRKRAVQKKHESRKSWGVNIWNNPQEVYGWRVLWWASNNAKWPRKVWECFPRKEVFEESLNWVDWTYIHPAIHWSSLESPELIQWNKHEIIAPGLSTPHCWNYPWTRCTGKLLCHFYSPSHEFAIHPANLSPDFVPRIGWQRMRSGWDGMRYVPELLWVVDQVVYRKKTGRRENGIWTCYQRERNIMTGLTIIFSWYRASSSTTTLDLEMECSDCKHSGILRIQVHLGKVYHLSPLTDVLTICIVTAWQTS